MSHTLDQLIDRLHAVEAEIQAELGRKRAQIAFTLEQHGVRFPLEQLTQQRRLRIGWWSYLRESRWPVALTAPLIYLGVLPFALLDLFITLYQRGCFPIYGIPCVRRADHLVFDRAELPYLNWIERLNCLYCSYANGVAAYARQVAARTEQYWCPIKHARRMLQPHERYLGFFEYGDVAAYRAGLERLRRSLSEDDRDGDRNGDGGTPATSPDAAAPPR